MMKDFPPFDFAVGFTRLKRVRRRMNIIHTTAEIFVCIEIRDGQVIILLSGMASKYRVCGN